MTPPLATALVFGERDAVLVDAPPTEVLAGQLADRIAATGRRLTHAFITHTHGNYWFAVSAPLHRLPDTEIIATAGPARSGRSRPRAP